MGTSVQAFTEEEANQFDFDVPNLTKLVPEELVPLTPLGKIVLDRNIDNFFAETEQVATCSLNRHQTRNIIGNVDA